MRLRLLLCALLLATCARSAHALSVRLLWDAPTTGEAPTGYTIYRRMGTVGPYELLGSVLAPTTTFTDTTATLGVQCYVATSYNAGGESSFSNEICFSAVAPPSAPLSLRLAP